MPKVKVEYQSKHSAKDSFSKVRGFLENDPDLRKLDKGYVCTFNDSRLSGEAKGKQFSAVLTVADQSGGAKVVIEVDLPLLLTPIKGMVQSTLEGKLRSTLA